MNTTELKKLADKCICHPISRSISDVESAGEAIKELLAIKAELVEALKNLLNDTQHSEQYNPTERGIYEIATMEAGDCIRSMKKEQPCP